MRSLGLYLRSRGAPALTLALPLVTVGAWAAVRTLPAGLDPLNIGVLTAALGVAVAAPTLASPDADLDRSAALPWPRRRAAHLIAIGTAIVAVLAATASTADPLLPGPLIVRDVAGFLGLTALTAALFGAALAWLAPTMWALVAVTLPPAVDATWFRVLTWPVQEAGATAATATAVLLAVAGGLAWARSGSR